MSSLVQSDVLKVEGLTPSRNSVRTGGRKQENACFLVFRAQNGHDLLHPMAPLPIQEDGDIRKIGFRALSMFFCRNEEGPRIRD